MMAQDADPNQRSPRAQALGLVISVVICFGAALLGNLATMPQIPTWYSGIAKPAWTPPDWVFGPVWSLLYAMMAVSAWLVWRKVGGKTTRVPLIWFGTQLVLNSLWSVLFFGMQKPAWSMVEVFFLWLAILMTIRAFWPLSRWASLLLVPYLLWVSFASILNVAIWQLNR
ncbi:MAG: TspO/MBR family protein [Planctomycetota bacterium]|nr:TspO/MBR family protein [Planctomycetota bacterium]